MNGSGAGRSVGRYEARIRRVRDYIAAHLDEDIDLERLADVACMSPYHWHRVYAAVQGETVATTVRRLRLVRAADHLINTGHGLGRIARECGFGSVPAFSRAFASAYGMPPGRYRREGSHARYDPELTPAATRDQLMYSVEIRQLEPVDTLMVRHTGNYLEIGSAFEQLTRWLNESGRIHDMRQMTGVYFDDPMSVPEPELRAYACVALAGKAPDDAPFERHRLDGGRYAVLEHKGPYAALMHAYQWFYGSWLPAQDEEAGDSPPFETYLNTPLDTAPEDLITEIHLPLAA